MLVWDTEVMEAVNRGASLTDQAVTSIKDAIVSGDLVPGKLYTASELGRRINVSRTPIREAVQILARRGLVETEKNRGVRVLRISSYALLEVFQVRLMLEVPLAQRATALKTSETAAKVEQAVEEFYAAAVAGEAEGVLRADRDFHRALLTGAENKKAIELLQEQRDFVLSTGMGTVPSSRSPMECFRDHADIIQAYRASEPNLVGSALSRHIAHTARMLIRQETQNRPEFGDLDVDAALDWLTD